MSFLLAAAAFFEIASAAASLGLWLPVLVAAESLDGLATRTARRFWLVVNVLPVALGAASVLWAFGSLWLNDPTADPHYVELRARPHLCLRLLTELPDAPFRFRLFGLVSLGLIVFAGARILWGLWASFRAQRLADRFRDETDVMAAADGVSVAVLLDSPEPECFLLGLGQPIIVATRGLREKLSDDEWAAMMAHEAAHARHGDLKLQLGLRALSDPLLWLPTTHYYLHNVRRAIEQACDETAAKGERRDALRRALQKMETLAHSEHLRRYGDLGPLRPVFPPFADPQVRLAALDCPPAAAWALPLPIIVTLEIGIVLLAIGLFWQPLQDTLYCAAQALLDVMGG